MVFSRREVVLVCPVDLESVPAWEAGPLPFGRDGVLATGELRRRSFNARAATALYDGVRVHRWVEPIAPAPHAAFAVSGVELVLVGGLGSERNALVAVHGALRCDGLEVVDALDALAGVEPASAARRFYGDLLEGHGSVMRSLPRVTTFTLVTPVSEPLDAPLPMPAYADWSAELQWLWLLASASLPSGYLPPPQLVGELDRSVVRLSAGWAALVLGDGAAMLGSGADMSPAYRLFDDAVLHFHTIYLDALLLAQMQRLRLTVIADELAALRDPADEPERLVALERDLSAFRNMLWWEHIGPESHTNRLLRAYQARREIPALLNQIVAELSEYARNAQVASAERTEALVGVVAVIGLPVGGALALMTALQIDDPRWVALALGVALAICAAILATAPGRLLLRRWLTLGRGSRRHVR